MGEQVIQYASAGHARARGSAGPSGALWWTLQISSLILGAGLIAGIGTAVAEGLSQFIGMLTPLGTLLILVALVVLMRGLRRSWNSAALEYLEQAVRLNLPLPPMLRAAETGERKFVRRRLAVLRTQIEDGNNIGDALARALPGLPPRLRGLVVSAERSGRLAPTLHRIIRQDRHILQRDPIRRIYLRWYPIILLLALGAVISGVGIYGMPRLMSLCRDFHLKFPFAAAWWTANAFRDYALPIAMAGTAIFCGQMFVQLFHPRYAGAGPMHRLTDRLAWNLPIARTIVRGRALGDVCDSLAAAIQAGRSLHQSLNEASDTRSNAVLQHRLLKWAAAIAAGLSIEQAARAARMPALVVGMVATASDTPDLSRIFEFLARYYDGQFNRAAVLLESAVIPGISIAFGGVVLLVALSLFIPLTGILQTLLPKGSVW